MARKTFLYYIFSINKKPYYVNEFGVVVEADSNWLKPDGQPAHLEFDPTGWKETLVHYARNITYWGLVRDMTVPMNFPRDGHLILKKLFDQFGFEAIAYLGMVKLDRLNLPYEYEPWYFSNINFVKYKRFKVTSQAEALEGGMSKLFKAYENQEYEIEFGSDLKVFEMDGITLEGMYKYIIAPYIFDPYVGNGLFNFNPLMIRDVVEGNSAGFEFTDSNFMQFIVTDIPTSLNWFLYAIPANSQPITATIEGELKLRMNIFRDNSFISWRIIKSNALNHFPVVYYDIYNPAISDPPYTFAGETRTIPINVTIPMDPSDQLWIEVDIGQGTNTGRPCAWEVLDESFFKIKFKNKRETTYASGLYMIDLFKKLVEKITAGQTLLPTSDGLFYKSAWLQNKRDIIITCGDAIRGLPNPKIKTSISDFFKSANHFAASLGIENEKLFIELWDYVFKNDIIMDLGEVDDASYEVAEDLIFNSIRTGGPIEEYNDVNGRFEFNQEQKWKTPVVSFTRDYDLTTPYRRDCYGAEFLRGLKDKDTTDDNADNDVWMINVQNNINVHPVFGFNYQKLYRPAYTAFSGAPVDVFNTELTPKHTILNHGSKIKGLHDKELRTKQIELTSAEKNKELSTTLAGVTVDQDEPIGINNLIEEKFQPVYINFTTKVPENVLITMQNNSYGKIKFLVKGREFFAYLFDGSIKEGNHDKQKWKVISAKENDLSKFYEPL